MKRSIAVAALIVAALWTEGAGAQTAYPSKLVRLICWTSAGSPLDVMGERRAKEIALVLSHIEDCDTLSELSRLLTVGE